MTDRIDPYEYNIVTRKVVIDGQTMFEARVKEFPDVREYSETLPEAYDLVVDTILTTADAFERLNRALPDPVVPQDEFSGRITLRLPKSLHRLLSHDAELQAVSLNQYLVNVLAYRRGLRRGIEYRFFEPPANEPRYEQIEVRHSKAVHVSGVNV